MTYFSFHLRMMRYAKWQAKKLAVFLFAMSRDSIDLNEKFIDIHCQLPTYNYIIQSDEIIYGCGMLVGYVPDIVCFFSPQCSKNKKRDGAQQGRKIKRTDERLRNELYAPSYRQQRIIELVYSLDISPFPILLSRCLSLSPRCVCDCLSFQHRNTLSHCLSIFL